MPTLSKLVGFPVDSMYSFQISGKDYRVKNSGVATLQLLGKIYRGIPKTPNCCWLLRFRSEIHSIKRLEETAVLSRVIDRTNRRAILILAIWLRGRCGGHLGTEIIDKWSTSADITIRKEVVRALTRMHAWSRLTGIADLDTNPRIRQLATMRAPRKYNSRLSDFTRHITPTPVGPGKQEFYLASDVELTEWRPAKPIQLIREILERIRNLVRGWQSER